jgi:hypothetical protein
MRSLGVIGFLALLAVAQPSGARALPAGGPPDFLRSAYPFSGYKFDLSHGTQYPTAQTGPGNDAVPGVEPASLENCSDQRFFCLRTKAPAGGAFTVPRRCEAVAVGDAWGTGDVRTEVLAKVITDPESYNTKPGQVPPLRPHGGVVYYYLLGNAARPAIVFLYAPLYGVIGLYRQSDPVGPTAFVEAKADRLTPLGQSAHPPIGSARTLLTDHWDFAACSRG